VQVLFCRRYDCSIRRFNISLVQKYNAAINLLVKYLVSTKFVVLLFRGYSILANLFHSGTMNCSRKLYHIDIIAPPLEKAKPDVQYLCMVVVKQRSAIRDMIIVSTGIEAPYSFHSTCVLEEAVTYCIALRSMVISSTINYDVNSQR
jgi:hypothetical protein